MDHSGDWIWSRIRQLASIYARLPAPPSSQTIEQDVQHVIAETLGRDIDRRLVAFYVRELRQIMNDARARRTTRDETDFTAPKDKMPNGQA